MKFITGDHKGMQSVYSVSSLGYFSTKVGTEDT